MSLIETNQKSDPLTWLRKTYTDDHKKQMHRAIANYYIEEDMEPKMAHTEKIPIKILLPYLQQEHDDWLPVTKQQMITNFKCINGMNTQLRREQKQVTDLENTIRKIKARQEEDQQEESESENDDDEIKSFMKTDEQQKAAEAEANHNQTPPTNKLIDQQQIGFVQPESSAASVLGKRLERPKVNTALLLTNLDEVKLAQDAVKRAKIVLEQATNREKEALDKLTAIWEEQ